MPLIGLHSYRGIAGFVEDSQPSVLHETGGWPVQASLERGFSVGGCKSSACALSRITMPLIRPSFLSMDSRFLSGFPSRASCMKLEGAPFKLRLSGAFCWRSHGGCQENSCSLTSSCGPLGFNLDEALFPGRVVTEAAPGPVLGTRHQSAMHRIPMNVAKLLDELALTPDIEIVVARFPKRLVCTKSKPPRDTLFQGFQRLRQRAALRFVEQQMHVLWHDDVSVDAQLIGLPDSFERGDKGCPCLLACQLRLTSKTAEREEVNLPCLLEAFQSPGHRERLAVGP